MWDRIEKVYDTSHPRGTDAVVIRPARDDDRVMLHDLAELDSALALTGPVLVAVVDGRPWAAIAVEDARVVADPFKPSAAAADLLRLRVDQMRAADGDRSRVLPRWGARRARA